MAVCTGTDKGMVRSAVQQDMLLATCDQHEGASSGSARITNGGQGFMDRDTDAVLPVSAFPMQHRLSSSCPV